MLCVYLPQVVLAHDLEFKRIYFLNVKIRQIYLDKFTLRMIYNMLVRSSEFRFVMILSDHRQPEIRLALDNYLKYKKKLGRKGQTNNLISWLLH